MKIKLAACVATILGAGVVLAACGGTSKPPTQTHPPPPITTTPPPPPPPPPSSVAFPDFVKMVLKKPADSKPVTVNGVKFTFPDLNNPKAFCDVLPAATIGPCAGNGGGS
jgi:multidrug efflux pump subunit AcrA (membrane-fusion protein)